MLYLDSLIENQSGNIALFDTLTSPACWSKQTVIFARFHKGWSFHPAGQRVDITVLQSNLFNIYSVINVFQNELTISRYKENVRTFARLMYDLPDDGLKRAVWWIEYVIRHKGARHLRSPILDIPWWQYFMLDVIGFLLAVLSATLLALYLVLKGLWLLLKKVARLVLPGSDRDNVKKKQ